MSKATSIYFIMLAVFCGGLWLILSFGNVLLHAPTDLSGQWQLWASAVEQEPAHAMLVEQSGRYIRIDLDKKSYDVKMTQDRQDAVGGAVNGSAIELQGTGGLQITFDSPANQGQEYFVHLSGPIEGTYLGTRDPSHSKPSATQPGSTDARH